MGNGQADERGRIRANPFIRFAEGNPLTTISRPSSAWRRAREWVVNGWIADKRIETDAANPLLSDYPFRTKRNPLTTPFRYNPPMLLHPPVLIGLAGG